MGIQIYVGNLPFETTDAELRGMFEAHGSVVGGQVVVDRFNGRGRGFGFVEMADEAEARAAIEALNGQAYGGRSIIVSEARPRAEALPFPLVPGRTGPSRRRGRPHDRRPGARSRPEAEPEP